MRPKGEDAPWTEVGTVASVADSVPFDLELPLWATGVQLQLFQEELFAVSIHAACVGCEFTCEPEWGECLTDYLERELCDVARSCKKLGCGALNEPVFRPSPPPPPSPAAPPSAPTCVPVVAARRALHQRKRRCKLRRHLPHQQLRSAGGGVRQPRVPPDHHRLDGRGHRAVPPLRIYGPKPGCEPTWRPVYRGDEAPVSINLLGADNNLYYNGQWHVTFRDDAECYPLTM